MSDNTRSLEVIPEVSQQFECESVYSLGSATSSHLSFNFKPRKFKRGSKNKKKKMNMHLNLPEHQTISYKKECCICFNNEPNMFFLPCGHIVVCKECEAALPERICPVCRTPLLEVKQAFF